MAIQSLVVLAAFLAIASGLGVGVSERIGVRYASKLECYTYSAGLGLAACAYLAFLLGCLGWLNRPAVFVSLGLLAALGLTALRHTDELVKAPAPPVQRSEIRAIQWIAGLLIAGLIGLDLIGALAPDIVWDANSYHLDVAKRWVMAGRMTYIPYSLFSNWPLNLSALYALEMVILKGSTVPQLTHLVMGVLGMLVIFTFVASTCGRTAAAVAAALFYSIPVMSWLTTTAICDLGIAFYVLLALTAVLRGLQQGDKRWLAMGGLGAGIAMGTKLTGLFGLLVLCLLVAWIEASKRKRLGSIATEVGVLVACAIPLALPWYVKSYLQAGNPVFPFAYSVLGGKYWTSTVNERFLSEQFAYMGIGRSTLDYLLLPLRLLVPNHSPYEGPISWMFLGAFGWGLLQRKDKNATYASIFALLSYVIWARFTTQQVRMLLPALGALSIVVGSGLGSVLQQPDLKTVGGLHDKTRLGNITGSLDLRLIVLWLVMLSIVLDATAGAWRERSLTLRSQVSVLLGRTTREQYLKRWFPLSEVLLYANDHLPQDGAILAFNEVRGYLSEREFIWGSPSLQAYVDYDRLRTRAALMQRLEELHVSYILINSENYPPGTVELAPISGDIERIYTQGSVSLYRLSTSQ